MSKLCWSVEPGNILSMVGGAQLIPKHFDQISNEYKTQSTANLQLEETGSRFRRQHFRVSVNSRTR